MWIARLTLGVTALAFISTVALAVVFLLAWSGAPWGMAVAMWGGYFVPAPFLLVLATWLLRHSAGVMMLRRGLHEATLAWCGPRSAPSISVGRDEAGLNRFARAEALRRTGRPAEALEVLERSVPAPRRRDVRQMLHAAHALALLDLGRDKEGMAVLEVLAAEEPRRGAREIVAEALRRRAQGNPG